MQWAVHNTVCTNMNDKLYYDIATMSLGGIVWIWSVSPRLVEGLLKA
jgi:hypothetical protein